MRLLVTFLFTLLCSTLNAQIISYKVNESLHVFNKNNSLEAKISDEKIIVSVDLSANNKPGTWDDIELIIIGKTKGNYLLGAAADEKFSNSGSELGTARLLLNYCDARNENHTKNTFMADQDKTAGYIKINTIENKKITGSFYANIAGVVVEGQFADIEVMGL